MLSNTSLVSNLHSNDEVSMFLVKHTENINKVLNDISKNFLKIGFLLYEVQHHKWYQRANYKSISEYALMEFGFKKSQTYNFLKVIDTFGKRDENGSVIYLTLNDKYNGYGFSQLCELLSVPSKYHVRFNPSMSVSSIRNFKKILKENSKKLSNSSLDPNEVDEDLQLNNDVSSSALMFSFEEAETMLFFLNHVSCSDIEVNQITELSKLKVKIKKLLPPKQL